MRVAPSFVALTVALGVAIAGCGSDDEGGSSSGGAATTEKSAAPSGKAAATVNVVETEFKLDPANPKLGKAGVVEFKVKNDGKLPHALEVEGSSGEVETDTIEPGAAATLKADLSKPGRYEWYCPVGNHRDQGMKGEITVAGGGSGGSTTSNDSGKDDKGSYGY